MKQFLFLLLFAGFHATMQAQQTRTFSEGNEKTKALKGTLTGIITDARTGTPLANATIYIADVKTGTISGSNGTYEIVNIPDGRHLVEVSFVGYTTAADVVDIVGTTQRDFKLVETVVENNAVIITGSASATRIKNAPVPVSIMRKEELLKITASNLVEALGKKPGVSSISTGPAIAKPVIRGLGYNRVVVLNDGVRQEGQQWGDEHGIEIDEASVQKVEILKGPGSVIYGSDAMAGVVNIISNVPAPRNTMGVKYLGNYQTNNRLWTNHLAWNGNANGFNWNFYLSSKAASDYRNKYDDYVFNSKFRENNMGGYIGYNGSWGYSHLLVSKYKAKLGIVEGDRDTDGFFIKPISGGGETTATKDDFLSKSVDAFFPHQQINHSKISLDNVIRLGKGRVNLNVGFQRNQREEFGDIDAPGVQELFFDLKTITYTAQYHAPEKNNWKFSVGISGMRQENTNKGEEQLIPDYTLNDLGGFVYARKSMRKLTFSAGARYDTRTMDASNLLESGGAVKNPSFSRNFSNFSGSLGAAFAANEQLNLKLNIARGFRAPSLPELGSNGNHEGSLRYEYGEPDLKSETSIQVDGGFEFSTDHLSFTASAFYNQFDNFIFYQKLVAAGGGDSLVNVNGEDLMAFRFGQRKAIVSGLEMTFDFHPHPLDWLHFENTISLVNGRFKEAVDFTRNMPLIPAGRWISELRGDFKKAEGTALRNLYLKLELDNTFSQENAFTAFNTETPTAGFSLLNLGVGTDVVNKKGQVVFSLHASANNITDVAYQNHLSRLKYAALNEATGRSGVFNMGRNFSFKVLLPLSFSIR